MPQSEISNSEPEKNDFFDQAAFAENNKISLPQPKPRQFFTKQNMIKYFPWVAIVLVVVVAGTVGTVQYNKAKQAAEPATEIVKSSEPTPEQQLQAVVDKVSNLMFLPEGEQPTLATVKDPAKLKNEPFFSRAEVGDKVLIYSAAKKAILYSEKENKIKEVAPVFPNEQPPAQAGSVAGESIIQTQP